MAEQTHTEADIENRVGLARLEEGLKHLERTVSEGFKRLEHSMTARDSAHKELQTKLEALSGRVDGNEKRLDKVYWILSAVVFVGTPILSILTKLVLHYFNL